MKWKYRGVFLDELFIPFGFVLELAYVDQVDRSDVRMLLDLSS